jgi:hypothetical protein
MHPDAIGEFLTRVLCSLDDTVVDEVELGGRYAVRHNGVSTLSPAGWD